MRRVLYILTFIVMGVLFNCSRKDDYFPNKLDNISKDTISIGLNFLSAQQGEIETKAPLNIDAEAISNLNIYIFSEQGEIATHKYIVGSTNVTNLIVNSGERYRVYAVANAGESLPCTKEGQMGSLEIAIESIGELTDSYGAILMSGKSDLIELNNGLNIDIELTRSISKFSLEFNYEGLNSGVEIDIKRAQLFNAPCSVKLFNQSRAEGGNTIIGEVYDYSNLGSLGANVGISLPFYLFENMQGIVASGALDNKRKEQLMSPSAKENSSYIELEYDYSSKEKRGTIIYRFYLGRTHADCNIVRNTNYLCRVYFKGNGSSQENSWSVDNSALEDLVTSITLDPTNYEFSQLNDTKQIVATVLPITANNKGVSWSSSDESVASVDDNGVVRSLSDGTAVIKATSRDGSNISATCNIVVNSSVSVTSIEVEPKILSLYKGEQKRLTATITPASATDKSVVWSSSNNNIATVDANGNVEAVKVGEVEITATSGCNSAIKDICKVKVLDKGLIIEPLEKTLYMGESFNISYKVIPSVLPTFTSLATSVASVDSNGKVMAEREGSAEIIVSAHGQERVCKVKVVRQIIEFHGSNSLIYEEEELFIPFAKLVPNNELPSISTSNPGVVEIMELTTLGVKVKGLKEGSVTITASTHGASDDYNIRVTPLEIEIYTIKADISGDKLLDREYYDGKTNYNEYGVRAVRAGANVEFANIDWSVKALLSRLNASAILREVSGSKESFRAQATRLISTQTQRGPLEISVEVRTEAGRVCRATQSLHVYEYAPVWLYWQDGNTTEYAGEVDGLAWLRVSKYKDRADNAYSFNPIIIADNVENMIPFTSVATSLQSGVIDISLPITKVTTEGKGFTYIYPKTYDEFRDYFANDMWIRIWNDTYSLYYEYVGKAL